MSLCASYVRPAPSPASLPSPQSLVSGRFRSSQSTVPGVPRGWEVAGRYVCLLVLLPLVLVLLPLLAPASTVVFSLGPAPSSASTHQTGRRGHCNGSRRHRLGLSGIPTPMPMPAPALTPNPVSTAPALLQSAPSPLAATLEGPEQHTVRTDPIRVQGQGSVVSKFLETFGK